MEINLKDFGATILLPSFILGYMSAMYFSLTDILRKLLVREESFRFEPPRWYSRNWTFSLISGVFISVYVSLLFFKWKLFLLYSQNLIIIVLFYIVLIFTNSACLGTNLGRNPRIKLWVVAVNIIPPFLILNYLYNLFKDGIKISFSF